MAYRTKGERGAVEMASHMKPPPNAKPFHSMIGVWADGTEHARAHCHVQKWDQLHADAPDAPAPTPAPTPKAKAKAAGLSHPSSWSSETPQGLQLQIKFRWDTPKGKPRDHLCTLSIEGTHVIQINAKFFDNAELCKQWMIEHMGTPLENGI
eukprot:4192144-Pyramimonas_sp.AAC.1